MIGRLIAGVAGTAAVTWGLAFASAVPLSSARHDTAVLRLSWSARPERIEVCRALSAAELAQREEHMRQRVDCVGHFATYDLRVESDGRLLHESVAQGAGLRHDRPMYLLRELSVAPGVHHLRIAFARRERTDNDAEAFAAVSAAGADTGLFAGRAERETAEHERRARAAIPARLALDTTLAFQAGRAIVVTLDPERRELAIVR